MRSIEDERIILEKRKINSKAFSICFLALWGILLFRQFVLQQSITEFIDIFLLTIGLSVYVTVNSAFKGLYLTYRNKQERKKVIFIGALVGSVTFVVVQIFFTRQSFNNGDDMLKLLVSLIVFMAAWIIGQRLLINISVTKADEEADDEL